MQLGWPSHNNVRKTLVGQPSGMSACAVCLLLLWPWFYESHSYPPCCLLSELRSPFSVSSKATTRNQFNLVMVLYKTCNWTVKSLAIGYYGCSKFTCALGVTGKVNGEKLKHNLLNSKTNDRDWKSPKTHIVRNQNNIPGKHHCIPGMFLNSFPRHLYWKPDAAVEEPLIWPSAVCVLSYVLSKPNETWVWM